MLDRTRDGFEREFGRRAAVVARAPGRVNLIGDHTDYTGGFVLPIAIDRFTYVAAAPRADGRIHAFSDRIDERVVIAADVVMNAGAAAADVERLPPWSRYVAGVAVLLRRMEAATPGADLWIGSEIPLGGGLASSAALEVGVGLALLALAGAEMTANELATVCRRAENDFAGSPCGIMDQLCCTSARAGCALAIDCDTLKSRHIPLTLGDARIVLIDTGVRHSIAAGRYAKRRAECAEGVVRLQRADPSIQSLRHVNSERLERHADELGEFLLPRIRHVVTENNRVRMACLALESGDVVRFGTLMLESHASLRDDYQVSCEELDAVVKIAASIDGVYGARMTGGGFGGCVVALATEEAAAHLADNLHQLYDTSHDKPANLLTIHSAAAAHVLNHRDTETRRRQSL